MCKDQSTVTSKAGSEVILKMLLGREAEIDIENLPWGDDERAPAGVETVVEAVEVQPASGRSVEAVLITRDARAGGGMRLGKRTGEDGVVVKEERHD